MPHNVYGILKELEWYFIHEIYQNALLKTDG
jgi:hypothetical protein